MQSANGFHVCVTAKDFERSIAFYKALGFSTEGQLSLEDDPEVQMQYLRHPSGGLVEILSYRHPKHGDAPARARNLIGGLNHFGLHVPDLKKAKELLESAGAEIVEEGSRGKYTFIFARGPDNELIGFAQMN